jgi:hypothetical protein
MRTRLSPSTERPLTYLAGASAYLALVTLVIVLLTTSGVVATIAGALTVTLLVGSYLLERWARRRTVYSSDRQPSSPTSPTTAHPTARPVDDERVTVAV